MEDFVDTFEYYPLLHVVWGTDLEVQELSDFLPKSGV